MHSQLALMRFKGRAVLVLTFDLNTMTLVALQTTKPKKGQPVGMAHVLETHAHKLIGVMPNLRTALEHGERFANEWIGGTDFQLCSCCVSP